MIVSVDTHTLPDKPLFVVFEGINGVGKSTLLSRTHARLQAKGTRGCVVTREPGGTRLGVELRRILQESPDLLVSPRAELLLFAADRAQHIDSVIVPALSEGKHVFSDRFVYSSLAFQGRGRGLDISLVEQLCDIAAKGVVPDLVVLIDLDPSVALARASSRSALTTDTFEGEEQSFHARVRQGFLDVAKERPEPFVILDGGMSPDALEERLWGLFAPIS